MGVIFGLTFMSATANAARTEVDLCGSGWNLWRDGAASWEKDDLFLPPVDLAKIPANAPTGGWGQLTAAKGLAVAVPGTAEEYLSDGKGPESAILGVTWWYRTIRVPEFAGPHRIRLKFESVRQRAEVYVNGKLVGYDLVGNSPFEVDITDFVQPGQEAQLAVRITNPGGIYDWRDFGTIPWGKYRLPMSHGFGGITGGVKLVLTEAVHLDDISMQNTPDPHVAKALVSIRNTTGVGAQRTLEVSVVEKRNPAKEVFRNRMTNLEIKPGNQTFTVNVSAPKASLWDPDHPELYVCRAILREGGKTTDSLERTFGFRWFAPEGIGSDAMFRLNGKRIVLRTAISWGFWPINGIYPTEAWTERQIRDAKAFGLNMLNFHRSIGNPSMMDKADEQGLLLYEEPGGYVSGGTDPFGQALAREKLMRMVRRDRSHPSMVLYNMINEQWRNYGADTNEALFTIHRDDLKAAHAADPSRVITYASAFAEDEVRESKHRMHMRPFDDTVHMIGWFDSHRAGGPSTWQQNFYVNPTNHYGFTQNKTEIVFRGEEGAVSAPPRLALIKKELEAAPRKGWDGAVYLKWYDAFDDFIRRKNLTPAFPTVDNLCTNLGVISLEHQGRKIEDHRICDANDGYAVNGWEAEVIENHSGIVDCFRNPKADPAILAYYNQPLYVAVKTRNQIVNLGENATIDFFAINETNLAGPHTLKIQAIDPSGTKVFAKEAAVTLSGGDVYGQLLAEAVTVPMATQPGMYRIEASLIDGAGAVKASGHDQVLAVDWKHASLGGRGAIVETDGKVHNFLKSQMNLDVPAYNDGLGPLDWVVVARANQTEPTPISSECLRDESGQQKGLTATFLDHRRNGRPAGKRVDGTVDFDWTGKLPDSSVPKTEDYAVCWKGTLIPPVSGKYTFSLSSDGKAFLTVDGKKVITIWQHEDSGKTSHREGGIELKAGKPVAIRVDFVQHLQNSNVHLQWSVPGGAGFAIEKLLSRARIDGTTLLFIDQTDTWMNAIAAACPTIKYSDSFVVGGCWVGGQYFVREHPLFKDLPVNVGMNWPYQAVVKGRRTGLRLEGEELVAGVYNSWPFDLGTAVGVIPCGKGRIVISTLDLCRHLDSKEGPANVARKLLCNYLEYANSLEAKHLVQADAQSVNPTFH
jgi:hypothetical protein